MKWRNNELYTATEELAGMSRVEDGKDIYHSRNS